MQNAKDSFYEELRNRIAAANPTRTITVRGVTRPAVLVWENELPDTPLPEDCFVLRWTALQTENAAPAPIAAMTCQMQYTTRGTNESGGLDRGRRLAAMDAELCAALTLNPLWTVKKNFAPVATGGTATALGSRIWWSSPAFSIAEAKHAEIARSATVTVWSFVEAGDQ